MADAHGSGPCVGNNMRVQVPSSALDMEALEYRSTSELFFFFCPIRHPGGALSISGDCKL